MQAALAELGISTHLIMPTKGNVEKLDGLQEALGKLVELKKANDRIESEMRMVRKRKELLLDPAPVDAEVDSAQRVSSPLATQLLPDPDPLTSRRGSGAHRSRRRRGRASVRGGSSELVCCFPPVAALVLVVYFTLNSETGHAPISKLMSSDPPRDGLRRPFSSNHSHSHRPKP